ncbi:MAG: chemotaxis protein CheX [bacterium]|nr:chemotaxis protein CheX [bacterium]
MEVEFINPFIIGALEIFEKVASIELKKTDVKMLKGTRPSNEIGIAFGVFGYIIGQVVYSFKTHTAERVVSSMMPNSSVEKQKEYFESALGALANMITGRATILLAGKEQVIRITPPLIIMQSTTDTFQYINSPTISIIFTSRFGSLEINIALRQTK